MSTDDMDVTPVLVEAVQANARARLVLDEGGLFITVDGRNSRIVHQVVNAVLSYAEPGAEVSGPFVADWSGAPLCYASIKGNIGSIARERALRILREAGYLTS